MAETKRDTHNKEAEEEVEVEAWKYVFAFTNVAVAKCALELGIADIIDNHGGSITLSDLSSSIGCSPPSLHRLMRFLVYARIFKEISTTTTAGQPTTAYAQTALSRRLLLRGENSMASLLLFESSPVMLAPWHYLSSRILAGNPGFEKVHGEDMWGYAAANPDHSKLLDDYMACDSRVCVPVLVEACPEVFDGIESLVDVGGGNGTSLSILVRTCPWIQGINFDLPHVVSVAPEYDGVKHVGGDMFKSVPKADAAFLKWVLHDWNDEDCIKILKNCREAIPKGKGKVIIVEAVLETEKGDKFEQGRLMLDMAMMALTHSGKERTCKEWEHVLKEAGFSRYTIRSIPAVQSVIEAFP